jgi:hypothetical protein
MLSSKIVLLLALLPYLSLAKDYCKPSDDCWPTQSEIDELKSGLSPASSDCLEVVPTFSSQDEQGGIMFNVW